MLVLKGSAEGVRDHRILQFTQCSSRLCVVIDNILMRSTESFRFVAACRVNELERFWGGRVIA